MGRVLRSSPTRLLPSVDRHLTPENPLRPDRSRIYLRNSSDVFCLLVCARESGIEDFFFWPVLTGVGNRTAGFVSAAGPSNGRSANRLIGKHTKAHAQHCGAERGGRGPMRNSRRTIFGSFAATLLLGSSGL